MKKIVFGKILFLIALSSKLYAASINNYGDEVASYAKGGVDNTAISSMEWHQKGSKKKDTIDEKLSRQVDFDDYKTEQNTNCQALQTAIDNNKGGQINLPARQLVMGSDIEPCQIAITNAVKLVGKTWVAYPKGLSIGTQFIIKNPSTPLFYITGGDARGFTAENFSVIQDQPAPKLNWQPTKYQPVFFIKDVGGETYITNILALGVYDFIKTVNAGRLNANVKGQAFNHFFDVDQEFDISHYTAHIWPYWSGDPNVLKYQQANAVGFYSARNDSPEVNLFCFACFAAAQIVKSDSGNGSTTKLHGKISGDGVKYGIYITANDVTADLDLLDSQNESQPQGNGKAVVDGAPIFITGQSNALNISNMRADLVDGSSIIYSPTSATNVLNIGNFLATLVNQSGGNLITDKGNFNVTNFAEYPFIKNSPKNQGCGNCVTSLQQNTNINSVNFFRAYASQKDNDILLNAIGNDANINMQLNSKGKGKIILNNNTKINGNIENSGNLSLKNLLVGYESPTVLSGFNKGAKVLQSNGTAAFRLDVGSIGNATQGTIKLSNAQNGWNCFAQNVTTKENSWQIKQLSDTINTVTLANYDNGILKPWVNNDILAVSCFAF